MLCEDRVPEEACEKGKQGEKQPSLWLKLLPMTVKCSFLRPGALQGLTSSSRCRQSLEPGQTRAQGTAAPRLLEMRGLSEHCAAAHSGNRPTLGTIKW